MNAIAMQYNKEFLIDENKTTKQRVYFTKTKFTPGDTNKQYDQYFIKIYEQTEKGSYKCQGYIYFYLDFLKRESRFIGMFVNPEYRNQGIAQLLVSYWITFCLDNGLYDLKTARKQRKPFLLYLLKKFKFDLLNINEYKTSPNTISICREGIALDKCLYFKNPIQAETFKQGKIKHGDNYIILDRLTADTEVLDEVLLSTLYVSHDENTAYVRAHNLIDCFQKSNVIR